MRERHAVCPERVGAQLVDEFQGTVQHHSIERGDHLVPLAVSEEVVEFIGKTGRGARVPSRKVFRVASKASRRRMRATAISFRDVEQQDGCPGIVFGVGAEVQRGLTGAVIFRNVRGARKATLLAAGPVRLHVPLRKLVFEVLVAHSQEAPWLTVATAWCTRGRGEECLEIRVSDRIGLQAADGTLGEQGFAQRHSQSISC
jgi:hypothetical protein